MMINNAEEKKKRKEKKVQEDETICKKAEGKENVMRPTNSR